MATPVLPCSRNGELVEAGAVIELTTGPFGARRGLPGPGAAAGAASPGLLTICGSPGVSAQDAGLGRNQVQAKHEFA
jgi:hypothetical protein